MLPDRSANRIQARTVHVTHGTVAFAPINFGSCRITCNEQQQYSERYGRDGHRIEFSNAHAKRSEREDERRSVLRAPLVMLILSSTNRSLHYGDCLLAAGNTERKRPLRRVSPLWRSPCSPLSVRMRALQSLETKQASSNFRRFDELS